MTQPHTEFTDDHIPLAYLITFRSYGNWLHGGQRGSVDRFHRGYGTPKLPSSRRRERREQKLLAQRAVTLNASQRKASEKGIRETCAIRNWRLWAFNIRTNHVHSVVSARCKPEPILIALKANATRSMRKAGCWQSDRSPWVFRGSKKYLWTEAQLLGAIDYVLHGQGEPLPEFD